MSAPGPKRPARVQVDAPVTAREESHAPGTVNIWTGRVLKEYRKPRENRKREATPYRCLPKVDAGWTRGEASGAAYCCLYFARGICHHGPDCNFLHRVPTAVDEERHKTDYSHDIFGRERAPGHKDGRKRGVGSYERECRTLYVNYGGAGTLPADQLRSIMGENFKEWGPLESLHLVPAKTIAFVRYQWRCSAEFAKAAMHQQTLRGCDTQEVLDVRWADDDPNPRAVQRVQAEREDALRQAYTKAVNELPPDQKRARIQQLTLAATAQPGRATSAYPDTSEQYGGTVGVTSVGYRHAYEGWDSYLYQKGHSLPAPDGGEGGEGEGGGSGGEGGEGEGGGEEEEARWAAWRAWQAQQQPGRRVGFYAPDAPVGGGGPADDDLSRYLRPEDWASLGEQPPQQQQWQQQQEQQQQQAGGGVDLYAYRPPSLPAAAQQQQQQQGSGGSGGGQADDALAEEALGLLGGYGSGSDSE